MINTIILLVVFFVFLLAIFSNLSSRIDKLEEKIRVLRRDFDCLEYNCDAEYSKMRDIVNKTNTSINDRRNKTDKNKQVQKDTMIKKNQNSGCNNYLYSSSTSYDNNYYVGQSHNHDDSTSSSHNYGSGSSGGGGCSDSWSDSSSSCDCSSSD